MPTIGQKLEETRLERRLSVEDVAHATRIHPNLLLSIEADDFSRFPSVAYAKSFIRKYGDHLGLDLAEATEALNSGVTRFGDNEFMSEMKRTIQKDRRFRLERFGRRIRLRPVRKRGHPLFLNLVLGTLIAAIAIFYFLGYNAPSAQKAREEIARGLGLPLPASTPAEDPVEAHPLRPGPAANPAPNPAPNPAAAPVATTAESRAVPPSGNPPPAGSGGAAPAYPVLKEAVVVALDDALPAAAPGTNASGGASSPKPRATPSLDLDAERLAPPPLADLPAPRPDGVEPQPVLWPEGTDPAATTRRQPEGTPAPAKPEAGTEAGEAKPAPRPAPAPGASLRAVPVAASE